MTREEQQDLKTEAGKVGIKAFAYSDEMFTLSRGNSRVWVHDDGQTYHVRGENGWPYNTALSIGEVVTHAVRHLESEGSRRIWAI